MTMNDNDFTYAGERFADLQILRYRLDGWESLTLKQKKYIYCLAEATLWGRDITFDQFGKYNLQIRDLMERAWCKFDGDRTSEEFCALETYLKRIWFSNGIYHHYGCEKFAPGFSRAYLLNIIGNADEELLEAIFNPEVLPKRVNKRDGDDLVQTSAVTFYDGVTQDEAEQYYAQLRNEASEEAPSFGLNSTLEKRDGALHEEVWCAKGKYGKAIKQIVHWLEKAANFAENDEQREVIRLLTQYYETGDLKLFDDYSVAWVKATQGQVDFINGFIEVYNDPLGLKASWEGIVHYKDLVATERTKKICGAAQWFEDHSPVDSRFKKSVVKGVTANVVCAAMLGGDEYPSTAIGINLPNANWIRAKHGSKSVTIGNLTDAYNKAARGNGFREEFVIDQPTLDLISRYEDLTDDLHTDLHECVGHGSGQMLPGVNDDALKNHGNTIEEARADLFGLYYIADEKMVELGLLPNMEAWKAQYYTYMMNGLMTQLTRIEPGRDIEEAHIRNRSLIAHWCLEKGNGDAMQLIKRDGKTYLKINDYQKLRQLVGELLAEIQRIKSEGDYDAARLLVERYAVKVDGCLHEEILERYRKLNLAPYKGFLNPRLIPVRNADGEVIDINADYSETYAEQMMRYSRDYSIR